MDLPRTAGLTNDGQKYEARTVKNTADDEVVVTADQDK